MASYHVTFRVWNLPRKWTWRAIWDFPPLLETRRSHGVPMAPSIWNFLSKLEWKPFSPMALIRDMALPWCSIWTSFFNVTMETFFRHGALAWHGAIMAFPWRPSYEFFVSTLEWKYFSPMAPFHDMALSWLSTMETFFCQALPWCPIWKSFFNVIMETFSAMALPWRSHGAPMAPFIWNFFLYVRMETNFLMALPWCSTMGPHIWIFFQC